MGSVFISHSWSDKPLARRLAEALRRFEVSVWLDEAEIKIGDSLIEKIRMGIDSVDFVIAVLSKRSVSSEWVKKELDIAMNQEIEGKSVKVLPILAEKCTLPGFLKGKLYADMSTARRFQKSLPLVLDRLGVPHSLLSAIIGGASGDEATKHSNLVGDLLTKLESGDVTARYKALKSVNYEHKKLVSHPQVLNAIAGLLDSKQPLHLRLEAFRVLGIVEDTNFASIIFPFVEDPEDAIASRAIETLKEYKAKGEGALLLPILQSSKSLRRQRAVLFFLSDVPLDEPADALSAVDTALKWQRERSSDPGAKVLVAKILATQWQGRNDEILELMLPMLCADNVEVRMTLLNSLVETSHNSWIRRTEIKKIFYENLINLFNSNIDSEVALSWMVALFTSEFWRDTLWNSILSARASAQKAFFFELDIAGYSMAGIFDNGDDAKAIVKLLDTSDTEFKKTLLDILAELPHSDAMMALAQHGYEPSSWKAAKVLENLARQHKWTESLNKLFTVCNAHSSDKDNRTKALGLICRFHAGDLSLDDLIQQFPTKRVLQSEWGRYDIKAELKHLQEKASRTQTRRIRTLVEALEKSKK